MRYCRDDRYPSADGNRYEVIDGELFVTPAPAWRHQEEAVFQMHTLLAAYLSAQRVGHAVAAPEAEWGEGSSTDHRSLHASFHATSI